MKITKQCKWCENKFHVITAKQNNSIAVKLAIVQQQQHTILITGVKEFVKRATRFFHVVNCILSKTIHTVGIVLGSVHV